MLFSLGKKKNPRMAQLKGVSLFTDLKLSQLRIVNSLLHERNYLANEIIFDEDDEGQALYIVISGKVRVERVGLDDKKNVEFGPGEFFGELALLEDAPRTSTARATEDSVLLALFRTEFLSLLELHSTIGSKISYALARDLAGKLRRSITSNLNQKAEA
jgi:CRP/FNR family transcriptional regulator, cyclic AMP receptor protein